VSIQGPLRERVTILTKRGITVDFVTPVDSEPPTIDQEGLTVDAAGSVTENWIVVGTVWGRMTPKSGREYKGAGRDVGERSWELVIRYRTGVTASHAIRWKGVDFDIRAIRNADERKRYLKIDLIERGT
jgi:SPP1 family predicted phage head-tail adaptor